MVLASHPQEGRAARRGGGGGDTGGWLQSSIQTPLLWPARSNSCPRARAFACGPCKFSGIGWNMLYTAGTALLVSALPVPPASAAGATAEPQPAEDGVEKAGQAAQPGYFADERPGPGPEEAADTAGTAAAAAADTAAAAAGTRARLEVRRDSVGPAHHHVAACLPMTSSHQARHTSHQLPLHPISLCGVRVWVGVCACVRVCVCAGESSH